MYLEDQIALFDAAILDEFPKECGTGPQLWKVKMYGYAEIKWNQNDGHMLPHNSEGKITYDAQYDIQIFHLPQTISAASNTLWGLTYKPVLRYEGRLVCITNQDCFARIVQAMQKVSGLMFARTNQDTESVMKNDVKMNLGTPSKTDPRSQGKNYPPGLKAFNIGYAFETINVRIKEYIPPIVS